MPVEVEAARGLGVQQVTICEVPFVNREEAAVCGANAMYGALRSVSVPPQARAADA